MTMRNNELLRRFFDGGTSGKASRMEIKEYGNGNTQIVGYGWACYVAIVNDTILVFGNKEYASSDTPQQGWTGYSSPTTKHMVMILDMAEKDSRQTYIVDNEQRSDSAPTSIEDVAEYITGEI